MEPYTTLTATAGRIVSVSAAMPAASGAYVGAAAMVQPPSAAELHPHDWHLPEGLLDGPLLVVTLATVCVCERFRYYRALGEPCRTERPP
jgi:hypothetical protein